MAFCIVCNGSGLASEVRLCPVCEGSGGQEQPDDRDPDPEPAPPRVYPDDDEDEPALPGPSAPVAVEPEVAPLPEAPAATRKSR